MERLIFFQVGNVQFGLDMSLTRSIETASTLLAKQPGLYNGGALVLDGDEIPLYDFTRVFGDSVSSQGHETKKVMLVQAKKQLVAMVVDRVERVLEVESDQIEPLPPIFHGPARICFPRVLKREEHLILILNPEGFEEVGWERLVAECVYTEPVDKGSVEEMEEVVVGGNTLVTVDDREELLLVESTQLETSDFSDEAAKPTDLKYRRMDEGFKLMVPEPDTNGLQETGEHSAIVESEPEVAVILPPGLGEGPTTEDHLSEMADIESIVAGAGPPPPDMPVEEKNVELGGEDHQYRSVGEAFHPGGPADPFSDEVIATGLEDKLLTESVQPEEVALPNQLGSVSQEKVVFQDEPEDVQMEPVEMGARFRDRAPESEEGDVQKEDEKPAIVAEEEAMADSSPLVTADDLTIEIASFEHIGTEPTTETVEHEAPKPSSWDEYNAADTQTFTVPPPLGELDSTIAETPAAEASESSPDHLHWPASEDGLERGSHRATVLKAILALAVITLLFLLLLPRDKPDVPTAARNQVTAVDEGQRMVRKPIIVPNTLPTSKHEDADVDMVRPTRGTGEEVLRIETKDFSVVVERPPATGTRARSAVVVTGEWTEEKSYVVQQGDTLWDIAELYLGDPFRYPEIVELNDIKNPDLIHPGDIVHIYKK